MLCPAVLKVHNVVPNAGVFAVLDEISAADELEAFILAGFAQGSLKLRTLVFLDGIGVEEVVVVLALGESDHVRFAEQAAVHTNVGGDGALGTDPVDGSLDFSAVGGHGVAG